MIYIITKLYLKSLKCYNIKYKQHKKYKKILKINKYTKLTDSRNEFYFNDKIIKNKLNTINNKYDQF